MSFRNILVVAVFLLGLLVYWLGAVVRDNRIAAMQPRALSGEKETCIGCHAGMRGFSPYHDPAVIGCASCHLGNPREADEGRSHKGMVLIPGNMSDVAQTCGTANCHRDISRRVEHSLMTTMAGVITVDRFVFGEIDTLSASAHVASLGHSPADQHLRQLCASCHLGNEKTVYGPITERSRGGGCLACHLNPALPAEASAKADSLSHPSLTVEVTNEHCFGCHSRSGRISLGYEGWHETLLTPKEVVGEEGYRVLDDGRVLQWMGDDIHHQRGMDCIDCHSATELMGTGKEYYHKEEAVKVHCGDCHFQEPIQSVGWEGLDEESQKILGLRKLPYQGYRFLRGEDSGEIYWNIWVDSLGQAFLVSKNSGKKRPLKSPVATCTRGEAHKDVTCCTCHTAWAPQCVGCHTAYNPDVQSYDLLDKEKKAGKWEEFLGGFMADPPALGVIEKSKLDDTQVRTIMMFIPGMIMTMDASLFPGKQEKAESFHRLFAPAAPHTTSAVGRTCASCHLDPLAIGYGRGKLDYRDVRGKGRWFFTPEYAATPQDGLPQDAWIAFLQEPAGQLTTRPNARPFTLVEQQRILAVGACLTCHAGDSDVMRQGLEGFDTVLKSVSEQCLLPE
ncbi:MAG: cytochrome c3 family protein [Saprospirales bacterium]|nr:cytochrome c3 family protein [Saprospirales bacterium]